MKLYTTEINFEKMKKLLVILLIMIAVSACEKIIDIDLPERELHIVINGMINRDSLISVQVSKSKGILDNSAISYLPGAVVKLYGNDEFIENLKYTENGIFISKIQPYDEIRYTIDAEYPDLVSVAASTQIPAHPFIVSIDTFTEISIPDNDYGMGEIDTHYKIKIRDDDNSKNFYFLALSHVIADEGFDDDPYVGEEYEFFTDYDSDDIIFQSGNEGFSFYNIDGRVFSDEYFNGTEYTIDISVEDYYDEYTGMNIYSKDYIYLFSISKEFYLYVISYNMNNMSIDNPFAQPVQVYSNVENGLGIFGGYNIVVDSVVYEQDEAKNIIIE